MMDPPDEPTSRGEAGPDLTRLERAAVRWLGQVKRGEAIRMRHRGDGGRPDAEPHEFRFDCVEERTVLVT
jgi:hypothetical protein